MHSTSIDVRAVRGPTRSQLVIRAAIVGAAAFLLHLPALGDGPFLDDHLHQQRLAGADWSLSDLLALTTVEPSQFLHLWWQDRACRWDYSRPLAMAWMKALLQVSGERLWVLHLSSIVWHVLASVLVFVLAYRLARHAAGALLAGLMMAVYPMSVFTVGWLAAQNAILQTTLLVAATCAYVWSSGLRPSWTTGRGGLDRSLNQPAFFGTVLLFAAALGCRENAVVFPVIALACDLAYGGAAHLRRRWPAHLVLWLIAGAFAAWRLTAFGEPLPEVYLKRPQDWGYVWWWSAKLLHYVAACIWLTPLFLGPHRYQNPFVESPDDCLVMAFIVVVYATAYWMACRRVPGWWIWPAWILLAVLPVVPILPTPHSAYMAGPGFAIALALKPAWAGPRSARGATTVAVVLIGLALFAAMVYRVCWRGVVRGEQYTIAHMAAQDPPPPPGSQVFVINLPLTNIYLPLNLQQAWGRTPDQIGVHALTFAPHILKGPPGTVVEQIDGHSFTVALETERYFAGLLGQFLIHDMRQSGVLPAGEVVHGEHFDAEVLAADAGGVERLKFTFREPLDSPRSRFYLILQDCPGAVLQFSPPGAALPRRVAPDCSRTTPFADRYRAARGRLFKVLQKVRSVIRTDLYLTGD